MKVSLENFFVSAVQKGLKEIDIGKIAHSSIFLLTQGSIFYEISTTREVRKPFFLEGIVQEF